MKKILLITGIVVTLCMLHFSVQAQCTANFTWAQTSNNVISFTNTSTPVTQNTHFSWDFGDQQYDWQASPVHTYNVPGTYVACVYMYDSLNQSCSSTFCDTITVTGNVICNLSAYAYQQQPASCQTCSDGSAYAYSNGGTPPYNYSWSNGGTTSSVSGLAAGTYTCCITDANNCQACATVTIYVNSCNASFTWAQTSNNVITFTNTSTSANQNYAVSYWNFGDQQYDSQQNPVHTYNIPGTYYVCLTIVDSLSGCQSTFCDSVTVTGTVICNMTANAIVTQQATCPNCANGSAAAYAYNGTPPFTYSWSNGSTNQTATGLLPGNYSCCITDVNGCNACTNVVTVDTANLNCHASFTIMMDSVQTNLAWIYNTSTAGPGATFTWYWGDNTSDTGSYVSHVYNQTGSYTICLLVSDPMNQCYDTSCQVLFVPRLTQQAASAPFYVNVLPAGIQSSGATTFITIFPNPAQDELKLQSAASLIGHQFIIMDMTGRIVKNGKISETQIDIHDLTPEIYFLRISDGKGAMTTMKFVKE